MKRSQLSTIMLSLLLVPLPSLPADDGSSTPTGDRLTDFRVRADFHSELNADSGWAAGLNEAAMVTVDQPFRLRLQVKSEPGPDQLRHYFLEVRRNQGPWQPVQAADFPYPAYASPVVSIVSAPYPVGTPTQDLLPQESLEHGEDGAGQGGSPVSTRAGESGVATEWEWPLVVRLYADGPVRIEDGDRFAFRLAHLHGEALPSEIRPELRVKVPDYHLGGTFVETPGQIGPWGTAAGMLYCIMEPTETDNRFMVVRSEDKGLSWREVDGAGRPPARDLEAVDARLSQGVLHILHQEDSVWYHRFHTADAAEQPDRWIIRSESVARPEDPPVQSVALALLPDGRLTAFHADGPDISIRQRSDDGSWPLLHRLNTGERLSGIQAVTASGGRIYLVYTSGTGKAWLQAFREYTPIGRPVLLSDQIGTSEADVGSVLRPVILPDSGMVVTVYREQDGLLHERRYDPATGELSRAVQINDLKVVQNAVDSDQTGADLALSGDTLVLLFIAERSRDIFLSTSGSDGKWTLPERIIHGIHGSWVRAEAIGDGRIGIFYDAGSEGGSGMNRYMSLGLE